MRVWKLSDVTLNLMEFDSGTAKFDVLLNMWDPEEGLTGSLEYNTDLFETPTILRMITDFETVLNTFVKQPEAKLDQLVEMLAESGRKQKIAGQHMGQKPLLGSLRKVKPKPFSL